MGKGEEGQTVKEKPFGKTMGGWILISVLFIICLFMSLRQFQAKMNCEREEIINRIYRQDPGVARVVLNETMKEKRGSSAEMSAITDLGYTRESFAKQGNRVMIRQRTVLLFFVVIFLVGGGFYFWYWQRTWYQKKEQMEKNWQAERKKVSAYKSQWNKQKRLRENMKVFTENIAHQLKTPLARITLALDMMEAGNMSKKRDMCLRELEEVRSLVEEVLNLARMESGKIPLHSEPIKFIPMLEEAIEKTGKKEQYQWNFTGNGDRKLLYYGDEVWLLQAFFNLYDRSSPNWTAPII